MLSEKAWVDSGAPVIFLESEELQKSLYQARYDFSNGATIAPPFNHFALSLPPLTVINGYEVGSFLVSMVTLKEYLESYEGVIEDQKLAEMEEAMGMFMDLNDIQVNVYFKDVKGRVHSSIKILSENAEFASENESCADALLKIAVTLCVYNSATFGKNLVAGYPEASVKLPKGKNKTNYQAVMAKPQVNISTTQSKGKTVRRIKHRIPYFRNLRASRFYQNEHKNTPRGSRWVWVNEVDVDARMNTLMQ